MFFLLVDCIGECARAMLNNWGDSGWPCHLVSNLHENASSISSLSWLWAERARMSYYLEDIPSVLWEFISILGIDEYVAWLCICAFDWDVWFEVNLYSWVVACQVFLVCKTRMLVLRISREPRRLHTVPGLPPPPSWWQACALLSRRMIITGEWGGRGREWYPGFLLPL